jgi:hypothetical protein
LQFTQIELLLVHQTKHMPLASASLPFWLFDLMNAFLFSMCQLRHHFLQRLGPGCASLS